MSKRICASKVGVQQAYYSYAQGKNPVMQDEMISTIRSTGKSIYYYLIADDNKLEGL